MYGEDIMKKELQVFLLFSGVLLSGIAQAEPMVRLTPEKNDFVAGGTYTLQVVIEQFPRTEGGGLNLQFNPSVLNVVGVQVDNDAWGFVSRNGKIDNEAGRVTDVVFSSFPGISGNAVIAIIEIKAIKPGRSLLKLSESMLNPFAGDGEPIDVTLKNAQAKVRGH
jgi:hypothetical protein